LYVRNALDPSALVARTARRSCYLSWNGGAFEVLTSNRIVFLILAAAALLPAVTIGHIDDFSDGTTMGWFVPGASPFPPVNIATGGPAGAGDAYLQLQAVGGNVAGGRLSVLNDESVWAGDYIAAGIRTILMDVNNAGPDDLFLRLLFEDFPAAPGPPDNVALTTDVVYVPANSGWVRIGFAVGPADLVSAGLGTPVGALTDVDTIRIFHNPDPTFPGPMVGIPPVVATLGVDNIEAAVPEPQTVSLMIAGGLVLFFARRKQKQQ
jgi:hypothetical protein